MYREPSAAIHSTQHTKQPQLPTSREPSASHPPRCTRRKVQHSHNDPPVANTVRAIPAEPTGTVRPLKAAATAKPVTVSPSSFNDVQEMADRFIAKQPVIVNLQGVDAELSRRIIDFASGVCYGGEGQMEKVTHQVYLMTPVDVEVSVEDRRRLGD